MATTVLSDLDRDLQRAEALDKANRIRSDRARLRRDLRERRVAIGRVLLDPPECVQSMKVFDLLCMAHLINANRAQNLLCRMRRPVAPIRRIDAMTEGQRVDLADLVRKTRGGQRA